MTPRFPVLLGVRLPVLALGVLLTACLISPGPCRSLEESIERYFETGPEPEVHIKSFNGRIEVRSGGSDGVRATITKHVYRLTGLGAEHALDSIEVELVRDGNQITIEASGPQMRMWLKCTGSLIEVEVPSGARVFAETSNGQIETNGLKNFQSLLTTDAKIEVRDAKGEVRAETTNGAIQAQLKEGAIYASTSNAAVEVDARDCKLDLNTSNGAIEADLEGGSVRARSTSGRIEIGGRASVADAETTNGSIEIELGDSPVHVHARTTNASIEFEGRPTAVSLLRTSNGRIEAEVPEDTEFWVEASTSNGKIRHELKFTHIEEESLQQLLGRVGDDPPSRLILETSNSSIDIDVN